MDLLYIDLGLAVHFFFEGWKLPMTKESEYLKDAYR
jgi:hypothetical protein